jgi:hypothetical protein
MHKSSSRSARSIVIIIIIIATTTPTTDTATPLSHTAIVENKRLRHALTTVKAQQDTKHLPKIMTNSDKGGYKKNPRRVYGPDYVQKSDGAPAVEMTA